MSNRGTLEKLLIRAYSHADYSGAPVGEYQAYVNPNEITLSYEMEYDSSQGSGTTNSRMNFKKMKPGDMTLTFFIDGTGANGHTTDVQQQIESFQTVTGYNGDIPETGLGNPAGETLCSEKCFHQLQNVQTRRGAAACSDYSHFYR